MIMESTKNVASQVIDAFIQELSQNDAYSMFAEPIRRLLDSEKALKPDALLEALQTEELEDISKEVQE
jgi:hypothetical protein